MKTEIENFEKKIQEVTRKHAKNGHFGHFWRL